MKFVIDHVHLCPVCLGKGYKNIESIKCHGCEGKGWVVTQTEYENKYSGSTTLDREEQK